ncbi:MAG: hypothetical protein ACKVYV_19600 [Limisphaerales bacterium]
MLAILTILLSAVAGAFGGWISAYLKQKGQNLATKEDIAEITRRQEEIKAELANRSHFSRLRYEREVAVYQTVWKSLCDFLSQRIADLRRQSRTSAFPKINYGQNLRTNCLRRSGIIGHSIRKMFTKSLRDEKNCSWYLIIHEKTQM